jgi:hypothetical protein
LAATGIARKNDALKPVPSDSGILSDLRKTGRLCGLSGVFWDWAKASKEAKDFWDAIEARDNKQPHDLHRLAEELRVRV